MGSMYTTSLSLSLVCLSSPHWADNGRDANDKTGWDSCVPLMFSAYAVLECSLMDMNYYCK